MSNSTAVAEVEQARFALAGYADQRIMAVHGAFPTLDLTAMTITYLGRLREPIVVGPAILPE